MRNEGDRDNFIEVNGMREKFKELIFIVVEFILAIRENICQRKLFVCYHSIMQLLSGGWLIVFRQFNFTINQ
ncbi:hypothetical protein GCM10008922_32040 [Faecalicatena contorta]